MTPRPTTTIRSCNCGRLNRNPWNEIAASFAAATSSGPSAEGTTKADFSSTTARATCPPQDRAADERCVPEQKIRVPGGVFVAAPPFTTRPTSEYPGMNGKTAPGCVPARQRPSVPGLMHVTSVSMSNSLD